MIIANINAKIAIDDFDDSVLTIFESPNEIIVRPTNPIPNANNLFLFNRSFGSLGIIKCANKLVAAGNKPQRIADILE